MYIFVRSRILDGEKGMLVAEAPNLGNKLSKYRSGKV